MGAEFGIFLQRQSMMIEAHREQVASLEKPSPIYTPLPNQEANNEAKLKEIREHIAGLRGELDAVSKLPAEHSRQLAKWGKIYDRGEL